MKSIIWMTCLAAALAAPAHAKEHEQPFRILTGAFFALSVGNLDESVQWYTEELGLSVVLESHGAVEVAVLEGGGLLVELLHDPAARPLSAVGVSQPQRLHGFFEAGFLVRDFEKTVDQLRARGVPIAFGPFPASDQQRANLIIRDNSGNLIQIFGE